MPRTYISDTMLSLSGVEIEPLNMFGVQEDLFTPDTCLANPISALNLQF